MCRSSTTNDEMMRAVEYEGVSGVSDKSGCDHECDVRQWS